MASDVPLPTGDVLKTRADVSDLRNAVGFAPTTALEVQRFVEWSDVFMERMLQPEQPAVEAAQ